MKGKRTIVAISKLRQNTGQLHGVHKNPRKWSQERADKLRASLERNPDFLDYKPLLVFPYTDKREGDLYCVIGGNFRLDTLRNMNVDGVPCMVLAQETTPDELNRLVLLDNSEFGENDADLLADFPADLLEDCNVLLPQVDELEMPTDIIGDAKGQKAQIKITFEDCDQLRKFQTDLDNLIESKYDGLNYSVSGGTL